MRPIGLFVLLCGLGTGCERHPERGSVSGTIQFDGKPLSDGAIRFEPRTGNVRGVTAIVSNGHYELSATDGPTVGAHRVEITAYRPGPKVQARGGTQMNETREQYLPEQFNIDSTLSAEVRPGANTFDFTLTPP